MAIYDDQNREIPDQTPIQLPLGYEKPETLAQIMSRLIQQNQHIEQLKELETEEEADDFDVSDDDEISLTSPYQFEDMQEEYVIDPEIEKKPTSEKVETSVETPKGQNVPETVSAQ